MGRCNVVCPGSLTPQRSAYWTETPAVWETTAWLSIVYRNATVDVFFNTLWPVLAEVYT